MIRRQEGGVAIQVLGVSLMLLLLVAGLGLAETVRAVLVKTAATRALAAAVQSAALAPDALGAEARFREVLAANLGARPHRASVRWLATGERDPVTGQQLDQPAVSGRIELQHRLDYLGHWLPAVPLRLAYTAPVAKRKQAR